MPVRIFRYEIGRKKEKDMLWLENQINQFEKNMEEQGMQIRSINFSAAFDAMSYEFTYSIVHYGPKTSG
jgi:PIN domain nuclease of toxin-antitoxin system